jgi:hypothetical protein
MQSDMLFKKGDKLDLVTRHQHEEKFAPISTIGVMAKDADSHAERMRVRVFLPYWRPKTGTIQEFLRISNSIWLEAIGRGSKEGTNHLPCVHEIVGKLSEEDFQARHAALQPRTARRK